MLTLPSAFKRLFRDLSSAYRFHPLHLHFHSTLLTRDLKADLKSYRLTVKLRNYAVTELLIMLSNPRSKAETSSQVLLNVKVRGIAWFLGFSM